MNIQKPFHKTYYSPIKLVNLLENRGLSISDKKETIHIISTIGYYRLSAYMYPFLCKPKSAHRFKQGATFEAVKTLYDFDKKLRVIIFNEIEKIEIAVRSAIVNAACEIIADPFWITNPSNFISQLKYDKTISLIKSELERSHEDFINHFYETYSNPYPPAWILAEILPFGVLTNIFVNIKDNKIKKKVSQSFGLQVAPFISWLTIIGLTRNSCCHHARVWNKQNTIMPMMPKHMKSSWISLSTEKNRIYFNLCIIKYFVDLIDSCNQFTENLQALLSEFPSVDEAAMGFPSNWSAESLWINEHSSHFHSL